VSRRLDYTQIAPVGVKASHLSVVGSFELPQFVQLTSGSVYLSAR
jgi:hypothetical protein